MIENIPIKIHCYILFYYRRYIYIYIYCHYIFVRFYIFNQFINFLNYHNIKALH